MTVYRVIVPMVTAAAFPETIKESSMSSYYFGDLVVGADPQDVDRLLREGYLEVVEAEPEPAAG